MIKSDVDGYRDELAREIRKRRGLKGKDIFRRTGKELATNLLEKEAKTDMYKATKKIHQQEHQISKIRKEKKKIIEEKDNTIKEKDNTIKEKDLEIEKIKLTEKVLGGQLTLEQTLETIFNFKNRTDKNNELSEYYKEQLIKKIIHDINSNNYKYLLSNMSTDRSDQLSIFSIDNINILNEPESKISRTKKNEIRKMSVTLSPENLGDENFRKLYTEMCKHNEKTYINNGILHNSKCIEKDYAREVYNRILDYNKDNAYYFAENNDIGIDVLAENEKTQQVIRGLWILKSEEKEDNGLNKKKIATEKTNELLTEMYKKAEKVIDDFLMQNSLDGDPLGLGEEIKTFERLNGIRTEKVKMLIPLLKKAFEKKYPDRKNFLHGFNENNIIFSSGIATAYNFDINNFIKEYLIICMLGLEDNFIVGYTCCADCGYKLNAVSSVMNTLNPKNLVVASCGRDEWTKEIKPKLKEIVEKKLK